MAEKTQYPRVSFGYFFKTFLIVTFPLHVWAILMIFRDFEFVSERTEIWDAIGYGSYSLLFTLIESLMLAVIVWLFSLLLPRKWDIQRSLDVTGSIFIILAGASIVDMAFHAFDQARISKQYLYGLANYPTQTYLLIAGTVLITSAAVFFIILKAQRGEAIISEVFERIMLLSYFYLFLDFIGIVIVIIRNLSENF